MKKNNLKNFMSGKGFYVVLSLCFVIIIVSAGIITISNTNQINEQNEYAKLKGEYSKTAEPVVASEAEKNTVDFSDSDTMDIGVGSEENILQYEEETGIKDFQQIAEETTISSKVEDITQIPEVAINETNEIQQSNDDTVELAKNPEPVVTQVFLSFNNDSKMLWPVKGEVIMNYSTNRTIYDKTLDQYRVNDSISIASEPGSQVKAAARGIVLSVSNDSKKGCTIVLDHGNGWQTTYSQLQENVPVNKNEIVEAGDVIGGVGNPTKYGIGLGSHLDFKVTKDGETKDPLSILSANDK